MRRLSVFALAMAGAVLSAPRITVLAADAYPRTIVADAHAQSGVTTITSKVTITIDRLIAATPRTRVLDGLKYNGFQGFMDALRLLPAIGVIAPQSREVKVKYAWETKTDGGARLIVVSDQPLFFLAADASKKRAGYDLTVVDLMFDAKGAATGMLAGAARIKPAPDGVVLDDQAAAPVQLAVAASAKRAPARRLRDDVRATRDTAPVAQPDRATGFEPVGRGFESLRAHQPSRAAFETRIGWPPSHRDLHLSVVL